MFRKFCFSLVTFCGCLVAIKMDLFVDLFFALFLGMFIGVDKRAIRKINRNAIDYGKYEILKQLATRKFVKSMKEQLMKEKTTVNKLWKPKGRYTVNYDNTSFCLAIRWQAGTCTFYS